MKKLSILAIAAAGLLLGACSSDESVASQSGTDGAAEGYMGVNINLPTQPVSISRALNDKYDDGLTNEYAVHDCALLLFQGADEANATLFGAQIVQMPFSETHDDAEGAYPAADNITTSYQAVAKVSGFDGSGSNKLYVLAMLNFKNVLTVALDGTPTIAGNELKSSDNKKLSDIVALTSNADFIHNGGAADYFLMTNAVLSTAPGGTAAAAPASTDLFQLAEMDKSKIKETEAAAKADPAGDVFVERAVAKVTMSVTAETATSEALDFTTVGWTLDNMEPASFVTKNMGDYTASTIGNYIPYSSVAFATKNYRMIGNTTVKADGTITNPMLPANDAYRSYWCIDPQYDDDAAGMKAGTTYGPTGTTKPQYCYENTFNVAHQNYKNTTRAIIHVKLSDTETFWTVNEDQTRYKTQADATSYVVDNIVNNTDVVNAIKGKLLEGKSATINSGSFVTTFERNETTGRLLLKSIKLSDAIKGEIGTTYKTDLKDDDATIKAAFEAAIDAANNVYTGVVIREYQGGDMWYEARIQHFANTADVTYDLAPWNSTEVSVGGAAKPTGGSTAGSYPGTFAVSENNYLGRYGMVRNNWYDIEVGAFVKLGKPVDPSGQINNPEIDYPDTPDTPDDNLAQYISARIHVLSWAKRTQKWTF